MPHSKFNKPYLTGFSLALICAALTGCATRLSPPMTGYTCCNLRPYYSAVSSGNMLGGSILPAGTAVSLEHVKRGRYYGYVGDDYVTLSDDSPRAEGDSPWIGQVVVQTDPKIEYRTWSPQVQNAVLSAKVIPGMTKAQVLMALSYPPRDITKEMSGKTWRYWTAQEDQIVDINFDADGRVTGFAGKPSAVRAIEFKN
jgi:hypothetical protein